MHDFIFLPSLRDLIDILFLTVMAYALYIWFRRTRALRVLIGLVVLGGIYSVAKAWGLFMTTWVFQILWQVLVILLLILFQSEIRQVLEKVSPLRYLRTLRRQSERTGLDGLARVVFEMALERTGALIVLPRGDNVSQFLNSGQEINAEPEPLLIKSIFNQNSPTHDGAIVLDQGRLTRMGCILPLSESESFPEQYGTRHRAALGLSERSDAICLIVSEERGEVSTTTGRKFQVWSDANRLAVQLKTWLGDLEIPRPSFKTFLLNTFTKNWAQKLGSFALVSLAWLVLAGQQEIEITKTAFLRYVNIPVGFSAEKMSDRTIQVTLSGKRYALRSIHNKNLPLVVDLGTREEGRHLIKLSPKNLNLPPGVLAESVAPQNIEVSLRPEGLPPP